LELKLIAKDGQVLVDSREVAEMTNVRHDNLLSKISTYTTYLSTDLDFKVSDFFTENHYTDGTGRSLKSYLLTKIGCDMVANKMTGQKGVLFTAAYTKKFELMEKQLLEQNKPSYMIDDPVKRAEKWITERKETECLQQENAELKPKASYYDLVLQNKSLLAISKIAKDYGLSGTALNKILHNLGVQFKQGNTWLLYQKYADKGYAHSKTQDYDGGTKSKLHTYWTQKGRMFIYQVLKEKKGILPTIERENEQLRLVK